MKYKRKSPKNLTQTAVLLLALTIALTGCASAPSLNSTPFPAHMESAPMLDYQVPVMSPSIITDPKGYEGDSIKEIYFLGEKLPEEFRIVDALTKETVYSGFIISGHSKEGNKASQGEYNGNGEFTDFIHTGEYYIEADKIGRSYTFRITDDLYDETFREVSEKILYQAKNPGAPLVSMSENEYQEWMSQLIILMLSYELYPQVYQDSDSNQIPDILDAIYTMIKDINTQIDWQQEKTSYSYAAAMAKFSYLYQKFDNTYATEVLNMADQAFRALEKRNRDSIDMTLDRFYLLAAAELYRASGQKIYSKAIEEYAGQVSVSGSDADEKWEICLAEITYISTKQEVDMDICNRFMKRIMQQAEKIAQKLSDESGLLYQLETEEDMWEITKDMLVLSVVEYVITNHEYGQMIENQYHYLMGRNPGAVTYWSMQKERQPVHILNNRVWTAGFLMMLSEMLTNS